MVNSLLAALSFLAVASNNKIEQDIGESDNEAMAAVLGAKQLPIQLSAQQVLL